MAEIAKQFLQERREVAEDMTEGKPYKTILVSKDAGVLTITMNNPKKLNALTSRSMPEMRKAIDDAADDESIRAIVITGAGRGFCSGGDVNVVGAEVDFGGLNFHDGVKNFAGFIKAITDIEKPVIAAINGPAVGGGWEIAMACDIRIASEDARLGVAYVKMGLVPIQGGVYYLTKLVGLGQAKLFCFTGDIIDAHQAEKIGMVEKVVPAAEFQAYVKSFAEKLAKMPTKAIGMTKLALNRTYHMDLESHQTYVQNIQYMLFDSEDYKEGPKAFLEKRAPVFKGK